jgi:hypothetical protein
MNCPGPADAPVLVSDRTCERTLSVPWRTLLAWCAKHGITVSRIGRRPVVKVADVLRALDGGKGGPAGEKAGAAWSEEAIIARAAAPKRSVR